MKNAQFVPSSARFTVRLKQREEKCERTHLHYSTLGPDGVHTHRTLHHSSHLHVSLGSTCAHPDSHGTMHHHAPLRCTFINCNPSNSSSTQLSFLHHKTCTVHPHYAILHCEFRLLFAFVRNQSLMISTLSCLLHQSLSRIQIEINCNIHSLDCTVTFQNF